MPDGVVANRVLPSIRPPAPVLARVAFVQPGSALFEVADQAVEIIDQDRKMPGRWRIEFVPHHDMQLQVAHGKPNQTLAGWILLGRGNLFETETMAIEPSNRVD